MAKFAQGTPTEQPLLKLLNNTNKIWYPIKLIPGPVSSPTWNTACAQAVSLRLLSHLDSLLVLMVKRLLLLQELRLGREVLICDPLVKSIPCILSKFQQWMDPGSGSWFQPSQRNSPTQPCFQVQILVRSETATSISSETIWGIKCSLQWLACPICDREEIRKKSLCKKDVAPVDQVELVWKISVKDGQAGWGLARTRPNVCWSSWTRADGLSPADVIRIHVCIFKVDTVVQMIVD